MILLEIAGYLVLIAFVWPQILWPWITNQPLFPIVRGKRRLLSQERKRVEAEAADLVLAAEIEAKKQALKDYQKEHAHENKF